MPGGYNQYVFTVLTFMCRAVIHVKKIESLIKMVSLYFINQRTNDSVNAHLRYILINVVDYKGNIHVHVHVYRPGTGSEYHLGLLFSFSNS